MNFTYYEILVNLHTESVRRVSQGRMRHYLQVGEGIHALDRTCGGQDEGHIYRLVRGHGSRNIERR